jgi:diguanylate cyclase (GGDEF)-like protein
MSRATETAKDALAPPEEDPLLKSAAQSGEVTVARARLAIVVPLFVLQVVRAWEGPLWGVGMVMTAAALVWSGAAFLAVRRYYRPAVGYLSSAGDVTLVSLTLLGYVLAGMPALGPGARVAFDVYLLALAGTSFRYDGRAPLIAGGLAVLQFLGVCGFAATRWPGPEPFPWSMVGGRVLVLVAMTVVAAAIVRKARRLREASIHDRLTGLLNRAAFEDRLREELSRARRFDRAFAVALVDVDLFKRVNDTYGHAAGDAVLQQVAMSLRRGTRAADIVARWGGEEFAFLLPETRPEGAILHMERVRAAVAMEDLVAGPHRPPVRLTVSVGLAAFPLDGPDLSELLGRADRRLYEAKRWGRNRVVGARPSGPGEPERPGDAHPPTLT